LTGYLAGKRAVDAGLDEAVLDIGLNSATPGAKTFAVQEGAIDAGLDVPHNESVFAGWDRIRGEHIADYAEQLDDPLYGGDFDATTLPEHFDTVLAALQEDE
jgi:large subunit ribosomal protein L18